MHPAPITASPIGDELLSTSYVARALNVAENTVQLMADRNVLPCVRTSTGQRLFRRHDVVAELERRSTDLP